MDAVGKLTIRFTDSDQPPMILDAPGVEGYVIGRSNNPEVWSPEIDLTPLNARDKGVSRRHAVIVRYRGKVHLVDLRSVNGTFLNGDWLQPEIPYPVSSGDALTIGNITFSIEHTRK